MTEETPARKSSDPRWRRPRPRRADITKSTRVRIGPPGRRRLGFGELADERMTRSMAQQCFFAAVEEVDPRVKAYLEKDAFPSYRALFREAVGETTPPAPVDENFLCAAVGRFASFCAGLPGPPLAGGTPSWAKLEACKDISPVFSQLYLTLRVWGDRFCLSDPWCLDIALCTLLQLQTNELLDLPQMNRPTRFAFPPIAIPSSPGEFSRERGECVGRSVGPGLEHPYRSVAAPYEPFVETRAEAKLRLRPLLKEKTDEYLAEVESSHQGARRAQQLVLEHFRWLARRQCLDESYLQIAASGCVELSTVFKPIRELSILTGLTLRPGPAPGRRRGSRNLHHR